MCHGYPMLANSLYNLANVTHNTPQIVYNNYFECHRLYELAAKTRAQVSVYIHS